MIHQVFIKSTEQIFYHISSVVIHAVVYNEYITTTVTYGLGSDSSNVYKDNRTTNLHPDVYKVYKN